MNRPPLQQSAATNPALRGPARSSQWPNKAADEPSRTKNKVYVQPSIETGQSQFVDVMSCRKPASEHVAGWWMPTARASGSQKTLKPYAMPMER